MVPALSDRDFILQRVVRTLSESENPSSASNLVLQLALTELVKQIMREMAQDTEADNLRDDLLKKAIQLTAQRIGEQVEIADLPSVLSPYFERIYRSQRPVAKEIVELGMRLRQARQGEVLRFPKIVTDAPVPFRVTELGIRWNPEGLIAQPLAACRLNLDRMRQEYQARGLGYPWEIEIEDFVFIVEADCTIITFLEGVPASVAEQAKSALEQLAYNLYAPLKD